MKINKLILAVLAAAAAFACTPEKQPEEPKDTTPAVLKSFALLKVDNAILDEDVAVEAIAPSMILRIPGGGAGKTLVATVTAGENDVVKANGKEAVQGKVTFDASVPVDIIVTNTKSELTATYEVKIGKVLQIVPKKLATYQEPDAKLGNDVCLAINPTDNSPYILYRRTKTVDGTAEKSIRLAVVRWNGTAFEPVGPLGFTGLDRSAVFCDLAFNDGTPYVLSYGETAASISGVRKFNGTEWEPVGTAGFGDKITASYYKPQLYFVNGKPGFATSDNSAKANEEYRNAVTYTFDGAAWNKGKFLPGLPKYGEKGGSDGLFYGATIATNSKGETYAVTSSNLYGYYLYKIGSNGAWEKLAEFTPTGEEYGIPTNLSLQVGAGDVLYLLAGHSKQVQEQVYRIKSNPWSFEAFGNVLNVTAGSNGSLKESMRITANPVNGQIVGVKTDPETSAPAYALIDENRQWTEFKPISDLSAAGDLGMAITSDGTSYFAFIHQNEDKTLQLEFYQIGLEDDILPE